MYYTSHSTVKPVIILSHLTSNETHVSYYILVVFFLPVFLNVRRCTTETTTEKRQDEHAGRTFTGWNTYFVSFRSL